MKEGLVQVIEFICNSSTSAVTNLMGDYFCTPVDVRQGPLSPVVFNICMENTMSETLYDRRTDKYKWPLATAKIYVNGGQLDR